MSSVVFEIKNSTFLSGQLSCVGGWVEGGGGNPFWATAICPGLLPPLDAATLHRLYSGEGQPRHGHSMGMGIGNRQ